MADYKSILAGRSQPLEDDGDLDSLIDQIASASARIVMLGESSHGTSEFYDWRRRISQRLISEHGFNFIAVEGDWPDGQRVHQHIVAGKGTPAQALAGYRRFPTWMWGNAEVLDLVLWLREFNQQRAPITKRSGARPIGFHGLDVYSLHDSMRLVVEYLERVDPAAAMMARRAYGCFEPFGPEVENYARATRFMPEGCEAEVRAALVHMEHERLRYSHINPDHTDPGEAYFDATMNARITRDAEAYYRAMISNDAESWNIRDRHMMDTLDRLLQFYGEDSRAIVWEHNTHIGDYRGTDMVRHGYVNIGGLAREQYGNDQVFLTGFTTYAGTVMAAQAWGEDGEVMPVPEAPQDSLEGLVHQIAPDQACLVALRNLNPAERKTLNTTIGHRAIGVVYDPQRERPGNYVPTRLADRYDALIFIDETTAVHPLGIPADLSEAPEAYPSGL